MIKGVGPGPASRIDPVRTRAAEQGGTTPAGVAPKPRASAETALSQMLADGPPVDSDRVAELRAKIADGSYTVDPRAIADKMIALDLGPRDDA